MNKMIPLVFMLMAILTTSFTQNKGYKIVGSATGLADSTFLYLEYTLPEGNKKIDSAYILKEKFTFRGEFRSKVVNAIIRTRDFSHYKFFWLENSVISFTAEKGKFREASITGSSTQDDENELKKALQAAGEATEKEQYISFIRRHPNSIISARLLSIYGSTWGKETTEDLYKGLSGEARNTSYGKEVSEYISLNKNLKTGDRYVDFEQEDTQRKSIKLSDFHGKVILLEFWGSWCRPCRKTNPELVTIYNAFKDKGFEILGVGAETNREAWMKAIENDKLSWPNVTDLKGDKNKAALIYGVSYYPTNFLIDKTGTIIARDLAGDKLREKLKEILPANLTDNRIF